LPWFRIGQQEEGERSSVRSREEGDLKKDFGGDIGLDHDGFEGEKTIKNLFRRWESRVRLGNVGAVTFILETTRLTFDGRGKRKSEGHCPTKRRPARRPKKKGSVFSAKVVIDNK